VADIILRDGLATKFVEGNRSGKDTDKGYLWHEMERRSSLI